jgi:heme/copper-type cytochrome/quinol oxidase subunit 2
MIFEYYLVFSVTTAFCMLWLNMKAKKESGVKQSTVIFYILSLLLGFIFAPVFFMIFLFYSEGYQAGIVAAMKQTYV